MDGRPDIAADGWRASAGWWGTDDVTSRLAMAGTLALTSGFPVALLALRARLGDGLGYRFLLWNLFLAWIPLGFAFLAEVGWRRHWSRRRLLLPLFGWLLFFPNAPYVVTDVVHLQGNRVSPLWFDALILFSTGLAGLLVGFVSLRMVQLIISASFQRAWGWIVSIGVLVLSGFGIYLGRFARYNSWDILTSPRSLLYDVRSVALDPVSNRRTIAISVVFTAFLVVTYLGTIALGQMRLPWRADPPDRAPASGSSGSTT
ncbi:MAG: DUF1361 domain-containing protein [Acidimicrobiales bacterium]